jgi:hypothetical protein
MNPRKPINENVQQVIDSNSWGRRSDPLLEASLNRILQHIGGGSIKASDDRNTTATGGHFAILTSWRKFDDSTRQPEIKGRDDALLDGGKAKEVNRANFKNLITAIRSNHLGAIRLTGSWLDDDSDPLASPIERSIFIPSKTDDGSETGLTKDLAISLGKRFNQDSIIYAGPETDFNVELWGINKENLEVGSSSTFERQRVFTKTKLFSGKDIEQALNDQKAKLLRKGTEAAKPEDKDWSMAGASQPGTSFKGGVPAVNPAKAGLRFEAVYEAVGQEPCSLGVGYLLGPQPSRGFPPGICARGNFLNHDTLADAAEFARYGAGKRIIYDKRYEV